MRQNVTLIAAIAVSCAFVVKVLEVAVPKLVDQILGWVWFFASWTAAAAAAIIAIAILFRWLQAASEIHSYKLRTWTVDGLHKEIGHVQALEVPIEKSRFPSPIKSAYLYFQHQKEAWLLATLQHATEHEKQRDPVGEIARKAEEVRRIREAGQEMKKKHAPQDHPLIDRMIKREIDRLKEES